MRMVERHGMTLARLGWTAGVALGASLPHWQSLPVWIPALLVACIGWRFATRLLGWPLPWTWIKLLLAFLAFSGVLMEYRTINGLAAGSALLVVMVALKFLEARTQRDHLVLIIISYFLVFASLLGGGGLIKGLYLLAFVWITTVGLLQLGRQGPLRPSWPTARLSLKLLVQAVPIMLVLFILFPRLPGPLWALPGDTSSGASGLSDEMSPGDITNLGLSDEVAFRVEFIGDPPAQADMYWRGPVLADFNGRTWKRLQGMRRRVSDTITYLGDRSEYRVSLDSAGRGWAFALEMPESWSAAGRRRNVVMDSDYQLRTFNGNGGSGRFDYTVTSFSRFRAAEPLTPGEQAMFKRLPPAGNPRTRAMVDGWLADGATPDEIIERALDVFRDDAFFYTLTPPALGGDMADEFIFDTHEGFCEHYAAAFTIMLRMAGIPARVVTGYQGGELNALGDYFIIRQSDAHAWTEAWLGDRGWVRVDPITAVAPERISLGSARSAIGSEAVAGSALRRFALTRQLLLAWDAVNTYWNDWVVGYGPQMQRELLRWLGFDRPRWGRLLILAAAATVALLVLLSLYLAFGFRRERRVDPAARCFDRFARRLRRLDVAPLQPGESPSRYAARAVERLPGAATAIESITDAYLRARYEPDSDRRELRRLESLVRDFSRGYVPA